MNKLLDIKNCPCTLAAGYNTYSPTALRRMFDNKKVSHLLDFSNDENSRMLIDDNIGRISISGVQEKLSVVVEKGRICLAPEGVQGRYITKRFDISADGAKIKQEDFASLEQKTNETHGKHFKYTGSYANMGLLFPKYVAAWQVELSKFFRLVVFNYLFDNGDAHLKNFSLQQSKNGDYMLSPAYDLLNSSLHIQDDFVIFGKMMAVPDSQIHKIMKHFLSPKALVYALTERSFLEEKLKRMYLRSYEKRLNRLQRTKNQLSLTY